jgi:hypothetical protein
MLACLVWSRRREPSWTAPFTGPNPRSFGKLVTALRREGAIPVRKCRPWAHPLEGGMLVAAFWRTNLTLSQLAPLQAASKAVADCVIDHLDPSLALHPRKRLGERLRTDTVLIVDGILVPTRDRSIAEQSQELPVRHEPPGRHRH